MEVWTFGGLEGEVEVDVEAEPVSGLWNAFWSWPGFGFGLGRRLGGILDVGSEMKYGWYSAGST